ncbi:uncharacterized protein TRAVEDRAFT_24002 [Trametes versicolor FP-101664 SS1]|uniref:uncharacterized protein n=1 Tax=Trametes versicolor (strain FP-101664) TaxID=717944 RepID=UPI0004623EDB|nr:uncharacterized protein TRAVEDRAFT_24002 [Trametes versicolor FP-101664 SS1]EIW53791.1 hypothetical protein TRAVEDRAFT_24002 [Trametes versicolor FP-101664 SS1]
MVPMISMWNCEGEEVVQDGMPDSYQRWVAIDGGEPPEDERWRAVLRTVESVLSRKVVQMDARTSSSSLVLDVQYKDGSREIVRTPRLENTEDGTQDPAFIEQFWREIALLKWLKIRCTFPVPTVRRILDVSGTDFVFPAAVMDRMPGEIVLNVISRLPYADKERLVRAHADVALELFRLTVPQRIGSPQCSSDGATMDVCPWTCSVSSASSTHVYATLEDWLASMVAAKLASASGSDDNNDTDLDPHVRLRRERVLERLGTALAVFCARAVRPAHRRCVLAHDDLNHANILATPEGTIAAVIDWEYASVRPAIVAAEYPRYLRYNGIFDPKYPFNKVGWYLVSPEDAASLCELYREVVKAKDQEYWEALVEGAALRDTMEWLTMSLSTVEKIALLEEWIDSAFGRD